MKQSLTLIDLLIEKAFSNRWYLQPALTILVSSKHGSLPRDSDNDKGSDSSSASNSVNIHVLIAYLDIQLPKALEARRTYIWKVYQ